MSNSTAIENHNNLLRFIFEELGVSGSKLVKMFELKVNQRNAHEFFVPYLTAGNKMPLNVFQLSAVCVALDLPRNVTLALHYSLREIYANTRNWPRYFGVIGRIVKEGKAQPAGLSDDKKRLLASIREACKTSEAANRVTDVFAKLETEEGKGELKRSCVTRALSGRCPELVTLNGRQVSELLPEGYSDKMLKKLHDLGMKEGVSPKDFLLCRHFEVAMNGTKPNSLMAKMAHYFGHCESDSRNLVLADYAPNFAKELGIDDAAARLLLVNDNRNATIAVGFICRKASFAFEEDIYDRITAALLRFDGQKGELLTNAVKAKVKVALKLLEKNRDIRYQKIADLPSGTVALIRSRGRSCY